MAIETRYWNRIGRIRIEGPDGNMYEYGNDSNSLDFKFKVEKFCGNVFVMFSVGVLGLSPTTINFLATWNIAKALKNPRKIEVYAGYESDGRAPLIAKGFIVNAIPTTPPDMWLNIEAINLAYEGKSSVSSREIIQRESQITTVRKAFEDLARYIDLDPVWRVELSDGDRKIRIPKFVCDKSEIITLFANTLDILIEIEGDLLVAHDKKGWYGTPKNPHDISLETGMIEISHVDIAGAKIKTRLDDSRKVFSWVNLTSKLIPKASGLYYVIGKTDVGHLRGEEWYTELDLIRKVM